MSIELEIHKPFSTFPWLSRHNQLYWKGVHLLQPPHDLFNHTGNAWILLKKLKEKKKSQFTKKW